MGSLDHLAQTPQKITCCIWSALDIAACIYYTGIDPFTRGRPGANEPTTN